MKVHAMAEIMADEGRCYVCKDNFGVRWYGTGPSIYAAHGWPELTMQQVKEMFAVEQPPFGWQGGEVKESGFPVLRAMCKRYVDYAVRVDVRVKDAPKDGDIMVPYKTPKGVMFVRQKYIDAVDLEPDKIRMRCMMDKLNRPVFIAEDDNGKQYAVIMPCMAKKRIVKAIRDIGHRRFLIHYNDKNVIGRRIAAAWRYIRTGERTGI